MSCSSSSSPSGDASVFTKLLFFFCLSVRGSFITTLLWSQSPQHEPSLSSPPAAGHQHGEPRPEQSGRLAGSEAPGGFLLLLICGGHWQSDQLIDTHTHARALDQTIRHYDVVKCLFNCVFQGLQTYAACQSHAFMKGTGTFVLGEWCSVSQAIVVDII